MHASFIYIFVSLCGITNALRLPVHARRDVPAPAKRGIRTLMVQNQNGKGEDVTIDNAKDVVYATNITLGGVEFPIQLDTGSSDVWVQTPFALNVANQTNIPVNLTFGIGEANGLIGFTDMSLGDYDVPNQAFLNVSNATDFGAIFSNGIFGIMGLSFDQGSSVFDEMAVQTNTSVGRTFLSNVFAQNVSAPNMFSVLLGRTGDTDGNQEGIFTIAEYDPGFPNITSQPKLPRTPAQLHDLTTLPRWSIEMDGMKVNGKPFQFNTSSVAEASPGKTVVVLDTGFTFSQIPPAAVDFIYQSIPGFVLNTTTGVYTVPCDATTDLTFEFGGVEYPIDPLDIAVIHTSADNTTVCQNAFQTISLPPGDQGLDMILGVSFLKNAYVSFDFGDWTPQNTTGVPFIQMLPTTDAMKAKDTFKSIRDKQVCANDASIASAATGMTAGSLEVGHLPTTVQRVLPVPLRRRGVPQSSVHAQAIAHSVPHTDGRFRVIVSTHRVPIQLPFMPHGDFMSACVNRILDSHGPVILALLSGIAVLTLVSFVAAVVLAVRLWRRRHAGEGYEQIAIKDEEY
ncbi:hypothetical protein EUX98_g1659 [Antrodiella citrinella]|uniref:Peptidase A1 domain-containing protein n=1 Tax=Antrodiella citrinella TaxID=2447956 RepID=A0A4S4N0V3_9APHY|nr:hypothetical protein EUX98_g1659 [Antrodiella citrinella]